MRTAHSFLTNMPYGVGYIKDKPFEPSFPPFTADELNTTDWSDLGKILIDKEGRMYMKVRYADTSGGTAGKVVAMKPPFNSLTAGQEPTVSSYSNGVLTMADSTTSYTANQLKDAFLFILGSAANAYGVIRKIYSNTATSSGSFTATISELNRSVKGSNPPYDGNELGGTGKKATPTANTKGVLLSSQFDVVLSDSANAAKKIPIGVLLGTVMAYDGSTYHYTWIQIYGPGLVHFTYDNSNARTVGCALITSTTAGSSTYTGATSLTLSNIFQIVGYSLIAGNETGVVIPAFICPAVRPF
jgi:hypothetical protein